MRSEHGAYLELEQETEQETQRRLRKQNMKTIKDESQRKKDINMQFWHSIKQVVFVIACAAIIIYTLIHFARG